METTTTQPKTGRGYWLKATGQRVMVSAVTDRGVAVHNYWLGIHMVVAAAELTAMAPVYGEPREVRS